MAGLTQLNLASEGCDKYSVNVYSDGIGDKSVRVQTVGYQATPPCGLRLNSSIIEI